MMKILSQKFTVQRLALMFIVTVIAFVGASVLLGIYNLSGMEILFKSEIGIPTRHELLAITSVNYVNPAFCKVLRSAIHNEVPMMVLNFHGSSDKLIKINRYHEISKVLSHSMPETILLFMDGYDVLFQESGQEIIKKYRSFDKAMVNSVEKFCWPWSTQNTFKYCEDYPRNLEVEDMYSRTKYPTSNHEANLAPRFLNSGLMMASTTEAVLFFQDALKYIDEGYSDDQEIANYIFTSGQRQMVLDYYSTLFQSMSIAVEDLAMNKTSGRFKNNRTNVYPSLLHFNGPSKPVFFPTEEKLWFHQEQFKNDHNVTSKGFFLPDWSFVHFKDACPGIDI